MRPSKEDYYLSIARQVAKRSTCIRRCYGAVIVNNDEIVSTGYNGSPRGNVNCIDDGNCYRSIHNIPSGERYELCRSVHAEANAIIQASRKDMIGSTIYLHGVEYITGDVLDSADSCLMCKKMIVNSGIKYIVSIINGKITKRDTIDFTYDLIKEFNHIPGGI